MFLYVSDDPRCFRCFIEKFLITNNFVPQKSTELQLVGIFANFQCSAYCQVASMVATIKSDTLKKMEKPRKTSKKQIFSSFSEKMVCDGVAL